MTAFAAGGGTMLDKVRMALSATDFAPYIQRIKDSKPDVAFIFVPGGKQATAVMKAWGDLGLKQAGIKLVTSQEVVPDDELPNMGQAPLGIVSSGIYSTAAVRPANQAFLKAWRAAYGDSEIATFLAVDGWDGMHMIFDVIKATNGKFDGDQAMKILANWKTADSPRGPLAIDPGNARRDRERLYPAGRKRERQACQCRVRYHPQRQGPVERGQSAEVGRVRRAPPADKLPRHRPPPILIAEVRRRRPHGRRATGEGRSHDPDR